MAKIVVSIDGIDDKDAGLEIDLDQLPAEDEQIYAAQLITAHIFNLIRRYQPQNEE